MEGRARSKKVRKRKKERRIFVRTNENEATKLELA